ncbi:MAG TPA: glycosyltransferase [Planctomycetaceae bacterium]|nr:glycosyltransferase [Planctomycetaceae bacterium]
MEPRHIGFVSTRFAGTDGVSLESAKWAEILWDHRHVSFWYAGKLDRDPAISMEVPEAYFLHPDNEEINNRIFGTMRRSRDVTRKITALAEYLKRTLYEFVQRFEIDILVVENALCMPMHIPLGVALTHFIAETGIPTIAHHHDFYWERDRFAVNAVGDFLQMAFPPALPSIHHVTINSFAQQDLAHRKGVSSTLVPNVLNFEAAPEKPDPFGADFRETIGLKPDDILVLQPTRVVPRKGIEHSIRLLTRLGDPRLKLVVTHESGDEGVDYQHVLLELAQQEGIDLRFVHTCVAEQRKSDESGNKVYALEDVYPHADLVTYPSLYEGFGNALLQAFYFRKPVLVNRYSIFISDIEPKGFEVIAMNGVLTRTVVERVRRVLNDPEYRERMVSHNFELAKQFFSYSVLRRKLRAIICSFVGADDL